VEEMSWQNPESPSGPYQTGVGEEFSFHQKESWQFDVPKPGIVWI
jgi:hypothetical protein